MSAIKLYRHALSGHSHRVALFLSLLGLTHKLIEIDLKNAQHKQAAFLLKNSFAQVPVIEDGHLTLADSNAILIYLAKQYDKSDQWLPTDNIQAAKVQQFLSMAADKITQGPAAARLVKVFNAPLDYQQAVRISEQVLSQLDEHLADREWLVGESATIADIANYTYIKHAPEGGITLDNYKHLLKWLARIEQLPGFIAMKMS